MTDQPLPDPEKDSQFAHSKRLSAERGTAPGVDPETGERAAITYRQLYNETNGDAKRAEQIFRDVARAGGYGDVPLDQALDVKSLGQMSEAIKDAVEHGVDLKGRPLDLYGKHAMQQQAQHQDNLNNAVREIIHEYEKKG